jgi:hypothetical protein
LWQRFHIWLFSVGISSTVLYHYAMPFLLTLWSSMNLGLLYSRSAVLYLWLPWFGFLTYMVFQGEIVRLMPDHQPGGPGGYLSSSCCPLTCLAWVTLPGACCLISIAAQEIRTSKHSHHIEVVLQLVGNHSFLLFTPGVTAVVSYFSMFVFSYPFTCYLIFEL